MDVQTLFPYKGEDLTQEELTRTLFLDDMRELIRSRMEEQEVGQQSLAEMVGFRQPTLSTFLAGKTGLSVENLVACCYVLGIRLYSKVERKGLTATKKKFV
jgi:hypothetical protein